MADAFVASTDLLLVLFFVALFAGFVDAIAGGGGLISTPAMLMLGVPPLLALGTNRLQSTVGELTSIIVYGGSGQVRTRCLGRGIAFTVVGAIAGSFAVSRVPGDVLYLLLPVLMLAILAYTLLSRRMRLNTQGHRLVGESVFMLGAGLALGFYNGFFGPGTGSLWVMAFVSLAGFTLRNASINAKPLNFSSNLVSLVCFIYMGMVDYRLGLVMAVGQVIGSYMGSRTVLEKGDRLVRPVFIAMTSLMTLKLLYDGFTSGRLSGLFA